MGAPDSQSSMIFVPPMLPKITQLVPMIDPSRKMMIDARPDWLMMARTTDKPANAAATAREPK